jgi:hypothetical protein
MAPYSIPEGSDFPSAIIEGLETCTVVLLVLSRASNSSKYVRREIERAVSRNKPIIPARVEDVALSGGLEFLISSLQWVEARESDSGPAVARIVAALERPDELAAHTSQKPIRGYIHLNAPTIAWIVASILGVCALAARLAEGSFDGIGLLALTAAAGVAALAGFLLQFRGWRPGQQLVVRWGDLAAGAVVVVATALSMLQLLLTPALVAIAVFAIYIAVRRLLSLRGWVVAAIGAAGILGAVIYGEGWLYRTLDSRTQALVVLPARCNGCTELARDVYEGVLQALDRAVEPGGLRLYPQADASFSEGQFARLSRVVGEERLRPRMLIDAIVANWDVYDDVVRVNASATACGDDRAIIRFNVGRWIQGEMPRWPVWGWDAEDRVQGGAMHAMIRMPNGQADQQDIELAANMLAAQLLRRLTATDDSDRAWRAARIFLAEYEGREGRDSVVQKGARPDAAHADTAAALEAFAEQIFSRIRPPDEAVCEAARERELLLVSARLNPSLRNAERESAAGPAEPAHTLPEEATP